MKCINNAHMKQLLCILCTTAVFVSGCGTVATEPLPGNAYNAYSYENSYLVVPEEEAKKEFFSSDLCVTNTINFGMEDTDSQVAKGAGAFNVTTGEVVYSQNMFTQLYPASTTKILTAYIILRDCALNEIATVSASAADQASDSSVCGLKKGDNITVNDLLYGMMLESGNDAAEALAEHHSGSVEEFAKVMNETAHSLGATKSHFMNPSGLPHDNHYTTVYDMYLIMQRAIKEPKFVEIVSSKKKSVTYTSEKGAIVEKTYSNNNRYFTGGATAPEGFEIVGGKTGTTGAAGYCLVIYSKNPAGEDIISIVFKADGRHNLYLLMNQILSRFAK